MIPIPPTSRLIAATAPVTTLKTRCVRSRWRRISRGTITLRRRARGAAHERLRDPGRGHDRLGARDPEHDLVDAVGPRVAAAVERRQRNDHRAVQVAGADRGPARARRGALLERADHPVPVAAEPQALPERAPQREERAHHRVPEHGHALPVR